jgi:hypothetical protein
MERAEESGRRENEREGGREMQRSKGEREIGVRVDARVTKVSGQETKRATSGGARSTRIRGRADRRQAEICVRLAR